MEEVIKYAIGGFVVVTVLRHYVLSLRNKPRVKNRLKKTRELTHDKIL